MSPSTPNSLLPLLATTLSACLLISACAFKTDDGTSAKPEPAKTSDVIEALEKEKAKEAAQGKLSSTKLEFVENLEASSYKLVVTWPAAFQHVELRLNGGDTVVKRNTDRAEFAVQSDQSCVVQIIAYSRVAGGAIDELKIGPVRAPKDVVFDSVTTMIEDEIITANRVFFRQGSQTQTDGYQLTINTNKLLLPSKDPREKIKGMPFINVSQIVTFPLNTVVSKPHQLNGSTIRINAKEARGELRIALIGVAGTPGVDGLPKMVGPETRPNPPAPENLAGRDGREIFKPGSCATGRSGELRGDCEGQKVCTILPGDGQKGKTGGEGAPGSPGGDGGAAGTLELNIENHSALKVRVLHLAGAGGRASVGGRGLPGSLGGRPGVAPGHCANYAANPGPTGDHGLQGPEAKAGKSDGSAIIKANGVPVDTFGPLDATR